MPNQLRSPKGLGFHCDDAEAPITPNKGAMQ